MVVTVGLVMVSLGGRCEVRYQLSLARARQAGPVDIDEFRRAVKAPGRASFDPQGTFFFDWLISRPWPTVQAIASDFAGIFDRDNLAIGPKGVQTVDGGIEFRHNFTRHDGIVRPETLEVEYDDQRAKVAYLAGRTLALMDSDEPVVYVRVGGNDRQLRRLAGAIADRHPAHRFALVGVQRDTGGTRELARLAGRIWTYSMPDVASGKEPEHDWEGNDDEWAVFLAQASEVGPPPNW
jgi:hypothetical protein